MAFKSKLLSSLSVTLSVTSWAAEGPPQAESKVNPLVIEKIVQMGEYLRSLPKFQVDSQISNDFVLESGQKIQALGTSKITAAGTNRLNVKVNTDSLSREYFYNGKQLTQYSPDLNYFTTVDVADKVLEMLHQVEKYYALEVPMEDLLQFGNDKTLVDSLTVAAYVGPSTVNGKVCDHFALRQPGTDWQLWISQSEKPLPCKLIVTKTDKTSLPEYSAVYRWNLNPKIIASDFTFKPGKDDVLIPFKKTSE